MKKIYFIILYFFPKAAMTQIPATGSWIAIQSPVNLSKKWQWHNDAGYRTLGVSLSAYQFLFRTGVRYNFNTKWSVATGTAFFYTRSSYQKFNREFGGEFRIWQEFNAQHPVSKTISLQNRLRSEQRWFSATNNRPEYFGFRFRYRVAATKNLTEKWAIQLANEYMRQVVNDKFSFNQNRLLGTALYKINTSTLLQWGYMWLKWPSSSQHIMTFTFQKVISLHGTKRES